MIKHKICFLLVMMSGLLSAQQDYVSSIERIEPLQLPDLPEGRLMGEPLPSKRWTVDKIVARVNGENILLSDLRRPRLAKEGEPFLLDEAIQEKIFLKRARDIFVEPSPLEVDRHIVALRSQQGLTDISDKEFEEELKKSGLTLDAYKKQLSDLLAVENVKRAEVGEKLIVTSQEVESYCTENPEYQEESYNLQLAYVPQEKIKNFKELVNKNQVDWLDLGWIERPSIAAEYSFVHSMKKGYISRLFKGKTDKRYKIIRLLDKQPRRLKTVDERYMQVQSMLLHQKKDAYLEELDKHLLEGSVIVKL